MNIFFCLMKSIYKFLREKNMWMHSVVSPHKAWLLQFATWRFQKSGFQKAQITFAHNKKSCGCNISMLPFWLISFIFFFLIFTRKRDLLPFLILSCFLLNYFQKWPHLSLHHFTCFCSLIEPLKQPSLLKNSFVNLFSFTHMLLSLQTV